MTIIDLIKDIRRRNPLLYYVGLGHAAIVVLLVWLYFVDNRLVMNLNAWLKPMKFAVSILIYVWTMGWLMAYLPGQKTVQRLSLAIAITMIVEMMLILFQAARGIPSHFNVSSGLNSAIFSVMGLFIGINTLANLITLILFFGPTINLERSDQVAWQFGLLFLFLGSISGGLMVGRLSHTVGASDGGPGLPFINWSTLAGDIRAAHFFTLHGLQLIPVLWWLISKRLNLAHTSGAVIILSLLYLLFCMGLHVLALRGIPVWPMA
jgi:hypothetical protein